MFIKQYWDDYSDYFDLERERRGGGGGTKRLGGRGREMVLIIKKKFTLFSFS